MTDICRLRSDLGPKKMPSFVRPFLALFVNFQLLLDVCKFGRSRGLKINPWAKSVPKMTKIGPNAPPKVYLTYFGRSIQNLFFWYRTAHLSIAVSDPSSLEDGAALVKREEWEQIFFLDESWQKNVCKFQLCR